MPRIATPSEVESCWVASNTPDAEPTSRSFTLDRMNWNSWPMLAPAPAPIRNRPGSRSHDDAFGVAAAVVARTHGAGGDHQQPEVQHVTPEAADDHRAADQAGDQADDHRRQGEPGVDGRPPLAELTVERDAQQQSAEGAEQGEGDSDAAEVVAVGEQRGLDQRVGAAALLPGQEGQQQAQAGGEQDERPGRPAVGLFPGSAGR